MNSTYSQLASAMLRGITDEIATNRSPLNGSESIPELIERVRAISQQAQQHMRSALTNAFPETGWNTSEDRYACEGTSSLYWVYDPIDGAYHYLQGLPLWSSSLVLVKQGRPIVALVYDPSQRELFVAEADGTTTLNGVVVKASKKTDLRAAVVGTAMPPAAVNVEEHGFAAKVLIEISKRVFVVRQMAAASLQLAYVAAGRLDAYVETGADVYDWMAGSLLVERSGGKVSALDGRAFGVEAEGIVAAGSAVHQDLQQATTSVARANVS